MDTNQIAKQAMDIAAEEVSKEIDKEIEVSEATVRQAAIRLVEYADSLAMEWKQAELIAGSLGPDEDPTAKIVRFQKKMIKANYQFQDMMKYVFDLQNKINEFLGQKVQMVYTYIDNKTGKVEVYKFDNDIEHLKVDRASQSHGGGISGRIRFSKKQLKDMEKMIAAPSYNTQSLDATFKEVHERATISRMKANMKGAFYVYWNAQGKWEAMKVTGMGALGEAYFNFFINEYTFTSFIEEAVGDYMTNPKYGVGVGDNASGFLQGDITKGKTEYGVKAAGASALGYMEIIDYARTMITVPDLHGYLVGPDGKGGLKAQLAESASANLATKVLADEIDETISRNILAELEKLGKGNINMKF